MVDVTSVGGTGQAMGTQVRKALLLGASVGLILVLGLLAAWGQLSTAARVDRVQRADRLQLQVTLGGLTGQYLQFAFLDAQRAAAAVPWSLRPDDPADRGRLEQAVHASPLASYGATLTTPEGRPLTSYAPGGLPSPLDPGLQPLRRALAAGRPGLSDVLRSGSTSLVAFAVPVLRTGKVAGLLLVYADVRSWPLQGYDSTLSLGHSAKPYVLDVEGTVTASGDSAAVGTRLTGLPAAATAGGSGVTTVSRAGRRVVVSYSAAAYGWSVVTLEDEDAFSSGLQASSQRDAIALTVLLTLVVVLLVWFNHSRQKALRRLAEDRLYDPLTGLALRRLLGLRLEAAVARHRRSRAPLAVLFCDLDGFKAVNDGFGHAVGDQLLVAVASRMREAVRENDFLARLGGDEFLVLLEATDSEEVAVVGARLRAAVEQPLVLDGVELQPRISVGGAVLRDQSRADDLLRAADLAMYEVKHGTVTEAVVVLDRTEDPKLLEDA
ncbi:MAG: diguanylate cyclase [Mycobacteriales bacterium]